MSNETYERREALESQVAELRRQMSGVRDHFVSTFASELPDRMDQEVRRWFRRFTEKAKSVNVDELRSQVAKIQGRSQQIAREKLAGPSVWLHEIEELDTLWRQRDYQPTGLADVNEWKYVAGPMAASVDEVHAALIEHFGKPNTYLREEAAGELSEPLEEILREYSRLYRAELTPTAKELVELTREIEKDESEALWDS